MKENEFKALTLPLVILVAINMVPGFYLRPLWSMIFCGVLLAYRGWLAVRDERMPPRPIMLIGQILAAVMIWEHYASFFGDEAAGTFLSLLACLKIFELKTKRDYFITILLCFLVLMSFLLLDQSLVLTIFLLGDATLLLTFLFALEDERRTWRGWKATLVPSVVLTAKALPMMVMIFLLFPRFSTGFGTGGKGGAKTGVSDSLKPGSVSALISSDELVFRATFLDGNMPNRQNLYWRGAVLDQSHGLDWERSPSEHSLPIPLPDHKEDIEIYLEPGNEKFMFTLDTTQALSMPNDIAHTRLGRRPGQTFELDRPLQTRERYYLHNQETRPRDDEPLAPYLVTEDEPSVEFKKLMGKVRRTSASATVREVLNEFRTGGYSYSMEPLVSKNIDQFLFRNKNGFCEHFAGSMATLLRHLRIPARVVVGFQGGTPSFLDNYISVRGHDAHAWVEYYDLEAKFWKRVDPTAEVEPQRIFLGSDSYLKTASGWSSWLPGDWNKLYTRSRAMIDEVDARWIGFLVRFDLGRQKEILAQLGMEGVLYRALPVFLILAIALALALLYFFEAQRREPLSEDEALYRQLLRHLKRRRIEKLPHEGPRDLLERLGRERPALARAVEPVLAELTQIRFGSKPLDADNRAQLRQDLKRLKKVKDAKPALTGPQSRIS